VLELHSIKKLEDIKTNFLQKVKIIDNRNKKPLFLPHLDKFKDYIKHIKMEYSRNIKNYAFPNLITTEKRGTLNNLLKTRIKTLETINNVYKGDFIDLTEGDTLFKEILQNNYINNENIDNFLEKGGLKNGNYICFY
jgi:hypothetical protein